MNKTTFIMLKHICFLVQTCAVFGLDAGVWKEDCVTVNRETIQCNFIPRKISTNITRVLVEDFDTVRPVDNGVLYVYSNMFSHDSWKNVKILSLKRSTQLRVLNVDFTDKCFIHLTNLKELHISLGYATFRDEAFYGLPTLSMLNLSGNRRISQEELEINLKSTMAVSHLNYLDISNVWGQNDERYLSMDSKFISVIFSKPIKGMNLSFNVIYSVDATAMSNHCGNMEYINISSSTFMFYNKSQLPLCTSIGVLDTSKIKYGIPQKLKFEVFKDAIIKVDTNIQYNSIKCIRADGIIQGLHISGGALLTVPYRNVTYQLTSLSFRDNTITRLDVRLNTSTIKLTRVDLSRNELEFIHPLFLNSNLQVLEYYELSDNKLYLMVLENEKLFSQIAGSLPNLRYIGLVANHLSHIPGTMFKNNHFLEVVDLSRNEMTKFTLRFSSKSHLRELYLHNNNIHQLDACSKQCLDSLHVTNSHAESFDVNVTIDSNPIVCSTCEDHELIDWTLKSSVIIRSGTHAISCLNSNGVKEQINKNTANRLQNVCEQNAHRKKMIIFLSTFSFLLVLAIVLLVYFVRRQFKIKKHKKEMEDVIALIRNGAEEYEFAVFLSFCSEDEEFVNGKVFDQLQTILQELIDTGRSIVSTGERNFRIARLIADETVYVLKRSSVVVIVVSNAYCQSPHCRMEFEQAYDLRRPIMLMFKGNVDEDVMFPVMRDLFNRYTRIVWELIEGEYKLKTTWLNIGTSILEMLENS